MFNLLDGYAFRVLARYGLATNTPVLKTGELGYTTDTKVFLVGNDTATPCRLLTTQSTEGFDFSAAAYVKYREIQMVAGGKIDGVDISTLIGDGGILISKGDGTFNSRRLISSAGTISIVNPTGEEGNIDINTSSDVLLEVAHTNSFTGTGHAENPLTLVQATTAILGGVYRATVEEVVIGVDEEKYVTPATLRAVLSSTSGGLLEVYHTNSFSGQGTPASELALVQATETLLGGVVKATQFEVDAGEDDEKYITPFKLKTLLDEKIDAIAGGFSTLVKYDTAGTFEFVAPKTGWYWVDVYGAGNTGGAGEYRGGYIQLTEGTSITVTVGDVPGNSSSFGTHITAAGGSSSRSLSGPLGSGGQIAQVGSNVRDRDSGSGASGVIAAPSAGPFGSGLSYSGNTRAPWPGGVYGTNTSTAGTPVVGGVIIQY